jgi:hypothetical protein
MHRMWCVSQDGADIETSQRPRKVLIETRRSRSVTPLIFTILRFLTQNARSPPPASPFTDSSISKSTQVQFRSKTAPHHVEGAVCEDGDGAAVVDDTIEVRQRVRQPRRVRRAHRHRHHARKQASPHRLHKLKPCAYSQLRQRDVYAHMHNWEEGQPTIRAQCSLQKTKSRFGFCISM